MLNFKEQEIILKKILAKKSNKYCADCGSHSPTWASLDFGVFVCSNCSGAHRGLGPTVTRIKSMNLDQWKEEWVENMCIGNEELNKYWEGNSNAAMVKKPRPGASLDEHNRYVVEKYVRRKFVIDKNIVDPLTQLRNKKCSSNTQSNNNRGEDEWKSDFTSQSQVDSPNHYKTTSKTQSLKGSNQNYCLLEEMFTDYCETNNDMYKMNKKNINNGHQRYKNGSTNSQKGDHQNERLDEFTEFVEGPTYCPSNDIINGYNSNKNIEQQHVQKDLSKISFDELLKNPQLASTVSNSAPQNSNGALNQQQHQKIGYGGIQQNQYGFAPQEQFQNFTFQLNNQQSYSNQFIHNPYIGYAPHNNLHASYNMIPQPTVSQFTFN